MELTRLGVVIDPTGAEAGAKKATAAAESMARSMVDDLGRVEKASDRIGDAKGFGKMAQNVGTSFADMRRMIIEMLDVFGLLNNGVGEMIRRGDSLLNVTENAGRTFGTMGSGADGATRSVSGLTGATGNATAGFGRLAGGATRMIALMAAVGAAILGVVVVVKALGVAFDFSLASMKEAGSLEQYTVRLAVLKGSFEEAEETVARFNAFADETPFTDAEVINAGTSLEQLSKGVLSTNEALKAIGGSAFVAGKSFTEIADMAGRAYNAMSLGMDYTEPLKSMQNLGLISGQTVMKVIQLGKEAEKGGSKTSNFAKQWALVYGDLLTKQQSLVLASNTYEGKLSTISGKWDALKAAFGKPIIDAVSPFLSDIIELLKDAIPLAVTLGKAVAAVASVSGNLLKGYGKAYKEAGFVERGIMGAVPLYGGYKALMGATQNMFTETGMAVANGLLGVDKKTRLEKPTPPENLLETNVFGGGGGEPSAYAKPIKSITEVLQEQKTAVQTLTDDWSNLKTQADQTIASMAQGISSELTNAITDGITGTKSWQEAFENLGQAVVRQIIQMVTQLWIQYTVALLLKNVMGAFSGAGGLAGMFGGASASVLHGGGGLDGAPKRNGVKLYHSGGKASSERIAMLERDETVLTAEQGTEIRDRLRKTASRRPGSGSGSGSTGVTILNVTDASQVTEAIAANPDIIVNAINRRLPAVRRLVQGGERR